MTDPTLALHLAQFAASRRRRLVAAPAPAHNNRHGDSASVIDPNRTVRTLLSAAWIR